MKASSEVKDSRMIVANARISAIEMEQARAAAGAAEAQRVRQELLAAKAVALVELQAARDDAEAVRLAAELPVVGAELKRLGAVMRAAFAVVMENFEPLLEAETRYADLWRQRERVRHLDRGLMTMKRTPFGFAPEILELLSHACQADQAFRKKSL